MTPPTERAPRREDVGTERDAYQPTVARAAEDMLMLAESMADMLEHIGLPEVSGQYAEALKEKMESLVLDYKRLRFARSQRPASPGDEERARAKDLWDNLPDGLIDEMGVCDSAGLVDWLAAALRSERERGVELADRLAEGLEHMQWCRSCGEGSWDDCDEGRAAKAALAEHRALRAGSQGAAAGAGKKEGDADGR